MGVDWMDGWREGGGMVGGWVGGRVDGWNASQTLQQFGNSGAVFLTHRSCLCRALPNSLPENLLRLSPGLVLHVYTPGQWAIVVFWTGNLCSLEMGEGTTRKQSCKTWCQKADILRRIHFSKGLCECWRYRNWFLQSNLCTRTLLKVGTPVWRQLIQNSHFTHTLGIFQSSQGTGHPASLITDFIRGCHTPEEGLLP